MGEFSMQIFYLFVYVLVICDSVPVVSEEKLKDRLYNADWAQSDLIHEPYSETAEQHPVSENEHIPKLGNNFPSLLLNVSNEFIGNLQRFADNVVNFFKHSIVAKVKKVEKINMSSRSNGVVIKTVKHVTVIQNSTQNTRGVNISKLTKTDHMTSPLLGHWRDSIPQQSQGKQTTKVHRKRSRHRGKHRQKRSFFRDYGIGLHNIFDVDGDADDDGTDVIFGAHTSPCSHVDRHYCLNGGMCVFVEALEIKTCREIDMGSDIIIQMHGKKTTITNTKVGEGSAGVADANREAMRTKDFTFDFSFWTMDKEDKDRYDDQEKVYHCLGEDVVQSGFEGYNACVFAYGQTGSGKTYTMMGTQDNRGLIPRICEDLFARMTDETTSYRTEVCYLEIYNEKVRDLLKSSASGNHTHNLRVREHPKEGPYIQGLSKYIVHSYEEIALLMVKGNTVRSTASTNMNDVSSRSHAIFTIVFTQATIRDGIPSEKTSKIHLVDLAGSERATSTGATGVRLREAGSINKSLVSLGTVIKQLAEVSEKASTGKPGKGQFIPYRDSVLTWLLKDSLGGNSRTIMVTTISPADVNYAESLSALRYANRAKNIINKPTVNEDLNVKLIRELKAEIERLKAVVGGDIDNISAPRMKERLHESEARMKVLTEEWSEKWKDIANILKEQGTLALRKEGLGVVLESTLPHLIGIDDDILSTGIMLFHLQEGTTRIGRSDADPPVDIVIAGQEVEINQCTIENMSAVVTLIPAPDAMCSVNGNLVTEPTKLTQGAVVLLGKTNMFRYNNPAEAAQMKEELQKHPNSKRKSGMTFSLSRTSLISQSMTDLYRSSENLSYSSSWEMDKSHREEQERIEELKNQIKLLENKYHADEEERLNQQVAMEIELEKKQKLLEKTYKDLETVQQQTVKVHQQDGVMKKLPKGAQIDELLKELEEKEKVVNEKTRMARDSLMEKLEVITSQSEKEKQESIEKVAKLDELILVQDKELEQLEQQIVERQEAAHAQDNEDQKVIDTEQQQLERLQSDFDKLVYETAEGDETVKERLAEIVLAQEKMESEFELTEVEMRERWKKDVDLIEEENKEIEEAWNDLKEQEQEYDELLASDKVSEKEKCDIEIEKEQLTEAKTLLKIEEEKVALKERKILDSIEVEMDEWEKHKRSERKEIVKKKTILAKETGKADLIQLNAKTEEKEMAITDLINELHKQEKDLKEFEKTVEDKKQKCIEGKKEIMKDKASVQDKQSKAVIKVQEEIITLNVELNKLDTSLNDELRDIQEERESLLLLKRAQSSSPVEDIVGNLDEKLKDIPLTEEELQNIEKKRKELEELQSAVEKANQELDDIVQKFDQARDSELDVIELEKVNLQERVRQDRINALVEQEVKRHMFEEKLAREQKRQLERDKERRERDEEIKRLKEAHHREIKQLKAKYERRNGPRTSMTPSQSNPYVTVMSTDPDGDLPRRKSTGSVSRSLETELPPSIRICVPFYRLQSYGSDSHYEYEVKIVVGDDVWCIMRRYSKFREFHQSLKQRIPEVGALVFPPKKLFSKNEKVAAERRQQLEFYLNSVIEICSKVPACSLHRDQNKFLTKQILCEFDSFFRKGLFESSKYGTA